MENLSQTPQYLTENLPKITIITPSFNQGQFIEETILSVINQNYPNLEYIIIDGGSTDETVGIIKKYEKWITYWVSEPDEGQSDAINKGLARATGDVFNWLNSDDYYLPNALLTVGKAFAENRNLNIFCGKERQISEDKTTDFLTNGTTICGTLEETIAVGNNNQPPTFMRLDVVKKLGGLNKELYFCMDAELWINYLVNYGLNGVEKHDVVLNVFRLHDLAKSSKSMNLYYKDRFNLLFSLANSLDSVFYPLSILDKNELFDPKSQKKYSFSNDINQQQLAGFISQKIIEKHAQNLDWLTFFKLYFHVFLIQKFDSKIRFYISPLIKLKRVFFPIK